VIAMMMWTGASLSAQQDSTKIPPPVPAVDTVPTPPPAPVPATTEPAPKEKAPKAKKDYYWLGFRAGGVMSRADFEGGVDVESTSKLGLDLALVFDWSIGGGLLSVGPEIHWVQKGTEAEGVIPEQNFTQKLDYLHIPVLARVHLRKLLGLQVFAGPSFDYLLSAKLDYDDDALQDIDNKDDFTDTTWGAVFGLGIGLGSLNFDIRYNLGFGDISEDPSTEIQSESYGAGITLMF
jgi:hypothetical protein